MQLVGLATASLFYAIPLISSYFYSGCSVTCTVQKKTYQVALVPSYMDWIFPVHSCDNKNFAAVLHFTRTVKNIFHIALSQRQLPTFGAV
jgi:hypothetical protein